MSIVQAALMSSLVLVLLLPLCPAWMRFGAGRGRFGRFGRADPAVGALHQDDSGTLKSIVQCASLKDAGFVNKTICYLFQWIGRVEVRPVWKTTPGWKHSRIWLQRRRGKRRQVCHC